MLAAARLAAGLASIDLRKANTNKLEAPCGAFFHEAPHGPRDAARTSRIYRSDGIYSSANGKTNVIMFYICRSINRLTRLATPGVLLTALARTTH